MAGSPGIYSVRNLMSTSRGGGTRVTDTIFSTNPFRVCCFEVKERRLVLTRTKMLDAGSVRISGNSLLVQSLPITQAPAGSFRFTDQGWVRGRDETRVGDVMDILVDDRLRAIEVTVKLKHQLVLPSETRNLLPKDVRKEFMRSMADAMSFTGDSYTLASLPVSRITSIRSGDLLYEVMVDINADDLSNALFRALDSGIREEGLVRRIFEGMVRPRNT
jgi:hypothetical protein